MAKATKPKSDFVKDASDALREMKEGGKMIRVLLAEFEPQLVKASSVDAPIDKKLVKSLFNHIISYQNDLMTLATALQKIATT